jgi:hypothetical protein
MSLYISRLKRFWCSAMHSDVGWPLGGVYRCHTCHQVFAVPWSDPLPTRAGAGRVVRLTPGSAAREKLAA